MKTVKPLTSKEIKQLPVRAQKAIKAKDMAPEEIEDEDEESGGKIESILRLYTAGVPRSYIVRLGYNKSTVYRQTRELDKFKRAPALKYYGFELYEARLQRIMKAKGLDREKAAEFILSIDLNTHI
jgi:hypothetical protein